MLGAVGNLDEEGILDNSCDSSEEVEILDTVEVVDVSLQGNVLHNKDDDIDEDKGVYRKKVEVLHKSHEDKNMMRA